MNTEEIDELKAQLQTDWPGWSIWLSDGGSWMATRRDGRVRTPEGFFSPRGSLVKTLMEPDPRALRAALENQAGIATEVEAFLDLDHTREHPVNPACPLKCLGLTAATENALSRHMLADNRWVRMVGDVLALHESHALWGISGFGQTRVEETEAKLEELRLIGSRT